MNEQKTENLSAVSELQLLEMIRSGDDLAFEEIADRYKPLVSYLATNYCTGDFDVCDFTQEGLLGLLNACKTFDINGGASFKNYASLCIKNRFISIIRKSKAKSIIPNENLVSIDDVELPDKQLANPEELIISEERLKELLFQLNSTLSQNEILVLFYYLKGMNYQEISEKTGLNKKAVDNALQRVKKKLQ